MAGGQRRRRGKAVAQPPRRRMLRRDAPLLVGSAFPVVGIGASAGGLDAFRKFFDALSPDLGMAFILIQHLDPTHQSMMVDLLAGHTPMTVQQAEDGMPLEREHIYIIPPGSYLSISCGALRLSQPRERHGARMPFDFFLRSLAEEVGERAICVILSGTGADGSLGLKAVKEKGGLVIAQDPGGAVDRLRETWARMTREATSSAGLTRPGSWPTTRWTRPRCRAATACARTST